MKHLLLARLHIVCGRGAGGQTSNSHWRLSASVTLHGGPAGGLPAQAR